MGKMLIFLMAALTSLGASAADLVYDSEYVYLNPMAGVVRPDACVDIYRVYRNVFPLVDHVFIGVIASPSPGTVVHQLYGASKGHSDLSHFKIQQITGGNRNLEFINTLCGSEADLALERATLVSQEWQRRVNRAWYFYPRMVLTPAFGQICTRAAEDVIEALGF